MFIFMNKMSEEPNGVSYRLLRIVEWRERSLLHIMIIGYDIVGYDINNVAEDTKKIE